MRNTLSSLIYTFFSSCKFGFITTMDKISLKTDCKIMKMRSFENNETYNRHCSCSEKIIFKRGNKVYQHMSCKMSVILTKNNSSLAWNICFLAVLRGENEIGSFNKQVFTYFEASVSYLVWRCRVSSSGRSWPWCRLQARPPCRSPRRNWRCPLGTSGPCPRRLEDPLRPPARSSWDYNEMLSYSSGSVCSQSARPGADLLDS